MVPPVYPPDARARGVEGTVILDVIIAADGRVKELTVLSGDSVFASAAMTAVRQWVYRTTLLNGRPVEVETTVTVTFTLHEPVGAE
jgi:TonB family protein